MFKATLAFKETFAGFWLFKFAFDPLTPSLGVERLRSGDLSRRGSPELDEKAVSGEMAVGEVRSRVQSMFWLL